LDQLTSSQISEWEAYDRLDPIGSWREDYRLAYLSALVTNLVISTNTKKGHTPKFTNPIDFMINWDVGGKPKEPKKQSVDELKAILLGIASSQNKRIRRQRKKEPPKNVAKKRNNGSRNVDSKSSS